MIVAQLARELQRDFTSITTLLKFEKLIAPNFRPIIEPAGETPALRKQRDVVKALSLVPQALD